MVVGVELVKREKCLKTGQTFLRTNKIKKELYPLLADSVKKFVPQEYVVYASKNDAAVTNKNPPNELDSLNSNQEEADTKIFVHLQHGLKHDKIRKAAILANDIDVVVVGIGLFENLRRDGLIELWISYGKGDKKRWVPIHLLYVALGPQKSRGLLFFHAFSGCDSCSGWKRKGKKSFYATWSVYP